MSAELQDSAVPYFAWDRRLTVGEIKKRLRELTGFEWLRLASWVLREAAFADVWHFLTPRQVKENLERLEPLLGRRKRFWKHIISAWDELGKL